MTAPVSPGRTYGWSRRVALGCRLERRRLDRQSETSDEGGLSLPGGSALLARPDRAVCGGRDQYGDAVELEP